MRGGRQKAMVAWPNAFLSANGTKLVWLGEQMPFADRVNTWRSEALRRRAQKRQAMALEIESKAGRN